MSVMLYKKGDQHTIIKDGKEIKCTAKVFKPKHLQAAIHAGWSLDPSDLSSKPGRKPADPVPDPVTPPPVVRAGVPDAVQN